MYLGRTFLLVINQLSPVTRGVNVEDGFLNRPGDSQLSTVGGCSRPTTENLSVGRRLYLKRVAAPPPA